MKRSALLTKYQEQYLRKPTSRVFAPLAESYRKLGMYDEALKVLRDGIRFNPSYPLGYIILAQCYFDKENYEEAHNVLRPFVKTNLDNFTLQKLYAETCEKLLYLDEALETYKYLLFLNPGDLFVSEKVKLLEKEHYLESEPKEFSAQETPYDDNWTEVSFSEPKEVEDTESDWTIQKVSEIEAPVNYLEEFKESLSDDEVKSIDLDDEYYFQEFDNEEEDVLEFKDKSEPIITHTLVDLYLKQNHFDKAIEFLESILKLHPNDKASAKKLESILKLKSQSQEPLQDDSLDVLKNKLIKFSKIVKEEALRREIL